MPFSLAVFPFQQPRGHHYTLLAKAHADKELYRVLTRWKVSQVQWCALGPSAGPFFFVAPAMTSVARDPWTRQTINLLSFPLPLPLPLTARAAQSHQIVQQKNCPSNTFPCAYPERLCSSAARSFLFMLTRTQTLCHSYSLFRTSLLLRLFNKLFLFLS
jgi:hypothetical protein